MNTSRIPLTCAVTIAALACASFAFAAREPYTERSDLSIPAAGLHEFRIENGRGTVQLRPSPDSQLHLSAFKICRAETHEKAMAYARETQVTAVREGDRYVVRVHYPRRVRVQIDFWALFTSGGWENGRMPRVEVRLEAQVPQGLPVQVKSVSGDIDSESIPAAQRLESTSGDILVQDAHGLMVQTVSGDISASGTARTQVRTASGDIEVARVLGALDVSTVSGTIAITQAQDSLTIESASGDVVVDDAPKGIQIHTVSGELNVRSAAGRVTLSSASGDIRARVRGPLSKAEIESTSGEVWLDLAGGMDASLKVSTVSGNIDCRVPVSIQARNRRNLNAKIGRGGVLVRLRSASGDITVTSGGK